MTQRACKHYRRQECWRPMPSFPDYDVSCQGRVRSWRGLGTAARLTTPRILKQRIKANGYHAVSFGKPNDQKRYKYYVHRAVLLAFRGTPTYPAVYGAHTPNADRSDNRLLNLKWATDIEDCQHRDKLGTQAARKAGLYGSEPREQEIPF